MEDAISAMVDSSREDSSEGTWEGLLAMKEDEVAERFDSNSAVCWLIKLSADWMFE